MAGLYRVELFFAIDPDRPDLDIGREVSNTIHKEIGGDQALHDIAARCGVTFCGRSWEQIAGPLDHMRTL